MGGERDVTLGEGLARAAAASTLLVACDYDGTLAAVVDDPAMALPDPVAVGALAALAGLAETTAAVVSGRPRDELIRSIGRVEGIILVGSHGAEFEAPVVVPPRRRELLDETGAALRSIAARYPGALVEEKPAAAAFHYRRLDPAAAGAAVGEVLEGPARQAGIKVLVGKMVIELAVVAADKGQALTLLRERQRPQVTVFIGDDSTDEDAFAVLAEADVGIKVGPGPTAAGYRVSGQDRVGSLLAELAEARQNPYLRL